MFPVITVAFCPFNFHVHNTKKSHLSQLQAEAQHQYISFPFPTGSAQKCGNTDLIYNYHPDSLYSKTQQYLLFEALHIYLLFPTQGAVTQITPRGHSSGQVAISFSSTGLSPPPHYTGPEGPSTRHNK